eukprot:GILK01007919.1.p1 GENE.GILK01007919.1~~GILK01007919.1.p1  ORF type:complete len:119 (+),score=15.04 GILK01007919.1:268-624(+)
MCILCIAVLYIHPLSVAQFPTALPKPHCITFFFFFLLLSFLLFIRHLEFFFFPSSQFFGCRCVAWMAYMLIFATNVPVYLATSADVSGISGKFFVQEKVEVLFVRKSPRGPRGAVSIG